MVDASFTTNGVTFTFENGELNKIKSSIGPQPENVEIAGTGPMGSINYDYENVRKTITLTGALYETATTRVAGYTVTTILAQKQWLESLCNGNQLTITLTSNYESQSVLSSSGATPPYQGAFTSTEGMIMSMNFTEEEGIPGKIPFEITFMVGNA